MGNIIAINKEDDDETALDLKTYNYAKKLHKQLSIDLFNKTMSVRDYIKNMEKLEQFIEYYEKKYNASNDFNIKK